MIVLRDATTRSTARIAAHLGFNCYEFQAEVSGRLVDVIDSEPGFLDGDKRPSGNGIPILFPFPNRIRGGRFTWEGREYHLPESLAAYDGRGNAIHGFCLDRPWQVVEQTAQTVVGRFQLSVDAPERLELWPNDFVLEIGYTLRGAVLRADITISNPGPRPLPWGFGTHPYFRLPLSPESEPQHCLLLAPVTQRWELADCLPTGERKPLAAEKDLRDGVYFGTVAFDDVFTGLQARGRMIECGVMDERAGMQLVQRFDRAFRELVVYTPPGRNAACLEPYTCLTDAVNLQQQQQEVDAGWRVLPAGEQFRLGIELEAGLIIV